MPRGNFFDVWREDSSYAFRVPARRRLSPGRELYPLRHQRLTLPHPFAGRQSAVVSALMATIEVGILNHT